MTAGRSVGHHQPTCTRLTRSLSFRVASVSEGEPHPRGSRRNLALGSVCHPLERKWQTDRMFAGSDQSGTLIAAH